METNIETLKVLGVMAVLLVIYTWISVSQDLKKNRKMQEIVEQLGNYLVRVHSQYEIDKVRVMDHRIGHYHYSNNAYECVGVISGVNYWDPDINWSSNAYPDTTVFHSFSDFHRYINEAEYGVNRESIKSSLTKYKIGDKLKITGNTCGHAKKIGDIVTITRINEIMGGRTRYYYGAGRYVVENDVELYTKSESTPDFKVGDKVKIIKKSALRELYWHKDMDQTIGTFRTVEKVYSHDNSCFLSNGWNYNFESLELVTDKEVQEEKKKSSDLDDYSIQCYNEKEVLSVLMRLGDLDYKWLAGQRVLDYTGWQENLRTHGCVYISPNSGHNITKSNTTGGSTVIGTSKFFDLAGGDACYYLGKAIDHISAEFDPPSVKPEWGEGITYPEKEGEPTTKEHDLGIKPEVKAKLDLSELKVSEHKL